MNYSIPTKYIVSLLWENGEPRATNFVIGNTYSIKGKKYKVDENIYDELVEYQKHVPNPFKITRHGKIVNVIGRRLHN